MWRHEETVRSDVLKERGRLESTTLYERDGQRPNMFERMGGRQLMMEENKTGDGE